MNRRRDVSVASSNQSPSPDAQSIESSRLQSMARSSRAVSEARAEDIDVVDAQDFDRGHFSRDPNAVRGGECAGGGGARRAESEVPQRDEDESAAVSCDVTGTLILTTNSSRSSRAGSEAPERLKATARPSSATHRVTGRSAVAAASESNRVNNINSGPVERLAMVQPPAPATTSITAAYDAPDDHNDWENPLNCSTPLRLTAMTSAEHVDKVRHRLYRTVKHGGALFHFFQRIRYPIQEDDLVAQGAQEATNTAPTVTPSLPSSSSLSKEPSPQPRGSTDAGLTAPPTAMPVHLTTGAMMTDDCMPVTHSPSPRIEDRLPPSVEGNLSFRVDLDAPPMGELASVGLNLDEPMQPAISAFALTTLPDPVSGAVVMGLCLGDNTGHVEYVEVSTSEASNRRIRKSQSFQQQQQRSQRYHYRGSTSTSLSNATHRNASNQQRMSASTSLASNTTSNFMQDLRGRMVVRRHSHKAYVQSINALTSAAELPCVKCLCFVRPHCSPSTISYLTASEHVIKLFHVRREGFSPLDIFPEMSHVVDRTFRGSRYFARLPSQSAILPVKEFGPVANSIQSLDVSADAETFMSVEDLQVFWWHFEAADTNRTTCIADFRPPSGALSEVEELVTAACFHPTHGSLFLLTRSSGILNIGDLRDPPSRGTRRYAITTRITPNLNPTQSPSYDEILCSISTAAFLGPDHVVTRDYLSLKLWDLRKPDVPCAMAPVMNYVSDHLDTLYDNDSIFDRFPVVVDAVSGAVVTGLYDAAVAVWQPLSHNCAAEDMLVHYRVDPQLEASASATRTGEATEPTAPNTTPLITPSACGGRTTVDELSATLRTNWLDTLATTAAPNRADSMTEPNLLTAEPGVDKVLNLAIAPGGERFGYASHNGQALYIFEREKRT